MTGPAAGPAPTGGARRPPKVPRPHPVPRVPTDLDAVRSHLLDPARALPLVRPTERPDEVVVTFAWHDPDAEQVLLFANRLTDETRLADTLLERDPVSGWWHASYRMGTRWRASYCFLVQAAGGGEPWVVDGHTALRGALDRGDPDPRNPVTCRNRAGVDQSVVSLPDAPAQPWLARRPGTPRGTLTHHVGRDGRPVWLWDPPGAAPDEPLPLLVALDGEVWAAEDLLPTTLANLLADGAVPPLRAVLPASGGRAARWEQLGDDERGVAHVVDEVLPWVAGRRPYDPTRVVVAGQSLGGMTALRCGLLRPDRVTGVVSHSASLWQDDLVGPVAALAAAGGCATRVHLAHGAQEWVLDRPHRDLARRLREAGVATDVAVHDGGHDQAWWRGGVADGLRWVLRA